MEKITLPRRPYMGVDLVILLGWFHTHNHCAVIYCTGAGKTALALALAALTMGEAWREENPRFTHVIIAAPTNVIKESFVEKLIDDGTRIYHTPVVRDESDVAGGLSRYATYDNPECVAIRLANNKLARSISWIETQMERDPTFARGKLLVLDEAHHCGDKTLLGRFRDLWLAAGGSVLSLTATPDRSDVTEIAIPPEVPRVTRSLTDQMAAGMAPREIFSDIIRVDCEASFDDETMFEPLNPDKVAEELVADWANDGYPKAIGRLKNTGHREDDKYQDGTSRHLAFLLALARRIHDTGHRVFIASATHAGHPDLDAMNQEVLRAVRARRGGRVGSGDINEVLEYENSITDYRDSVLDFILGMQTVVEGLNWMLCSHIYLVGVPKYLLPIVQAVGRAVRGRGDFRNYPSLWQWTSKLIMLAAGDGEKMAEAHTQHMLSVACYLAKFTHWSVLGVLADAFKAIPFETPEAEELERREVVRRVGVISEERRDLIQEALTRTEAAFARVLIIDRKLTHHQLADVTKMFMTEKMVEEAEKAKNEKRAAHLRDITEAEIKHVLILQDRAARDLYRRTVERKLSEGEPLPQAAKEALDEVVERFADEVRVASVASGEVERLMQRLSLTAENMVSFAEALDNYLPPEEHHAWRTEARHPTPPRTGTDPLSVALREIGVRR